MTKMMKQLLIHRVVLQQKSGIFVNLTQTLKVLKKKLESKID